MLALLITVMSMRHKNVATFIAMIDKFVDRFVTQGIDTYVGF